MREVASIHALVASFFYTEAAITQGVKDTQRARLVFSVFHSFLYICISFKKK